MEKNTAQTKFAQLFGYPPRFWVWSPGRVNLIGEHTDYNDGWVLPMAIERGIGLAFAPRRDDRVRVHALDYGETVTISLSDWTRLDGWAVYVQGMLWALREAGYRLTGWDGVLFSDLPRGAGLSSSAALTLAVARAALADADWQPREAARLAQKAENEWVGVACGIMDQMAVACGQADAATLLDCRTLETRPVRLPPGLQVVILDTGTRRKLERSAYNERRADCEQAARLLGVPALRDAAPEMLPRLSGRLLRRARHVITENARVHAFAAALEAGDLAQAGALLNASHASLRDDYEVSSPALDAITDCARQAPGCYGARMTGAGFGGCAVALVAADALDAFLPAVTAAYRDRTGLDAALYVTRPAAGTRLLPA